VEMSSRHSRHIASQASLTTPKEKGKKEREQKKERKKTSFPSHEGIDTSKDAWFHSMGASTYAVMRFGLLIRW